MNTGIEAESDAAAKQQMYDLKNFLNGMKQVNKDIERNLHANKTGSTIRTTRKGKPITLHITGFRNGRVEAETVQHKGVSEIRIPTSFPLTRYPAAQRLEMIRNNDSPEANAVRFVLSNKAKDRAGSARAAAASGPLANALSEHINSDG